MIDESEQLYFVSCKLTVSSDRGIQTRAKTETHGGEWSSN
jgi:hypothetical protein